MSERLTRPDLSSGHGNAAAFARELSYALDRLGIRPGDEFFVTTVGGEAKARRSDPDTSHAAAASVGDPSETQRAILGLFETWGPMIDERLEGRYEGAAHAGRVPQQSASGIRTRRSDLVKAGLLVDTGRKEKNDNGRDAIVWDVPPSKKSDFAVPKPTAEPESSQLFSAPTTPKPGGTRTYADVED
jgi:hypothetical protein